MMKMRPPPASTLQDLKEDDAGIGPSNGRSIPSGIITEQAMNLYQTNKQSWIRRYETGSTKFSCEGGLGSYC
ncbi:hypothetical protein PI125_g8273 [Phytophthora idaei]|nr:hypothetical protein PI125_g8273 [Phytophthora idaei]